MFGHPVKRRVKKQRKEQVWMEEEGNRKVVKVASSLASSLKEVCNSFVATVNRMDVTEDFIKNRLCSTKEIQAEVKHINFSFFGIVP